MEQKEKKKYGHLAKEIQYLDNDGIFEKSALLDQSFFGWDSVSMKYGLVGKTGLITEETDKLHTHDYDQILWFVSSNPNDMLELGAELEVTLGTNGYRHRVTQPSIVVIPKGTPHFSPIVRTVDRKFFFLSLNCTGELKADIYDENAVQGEGPWAEFRDEYNKNIMTLKFARKGPYHYGSAMNTDCGGIFTHISFAQTGIPLSMTWQTVTLPHQLGPRRPDLSFAPHVHTFDESLMFLGMNTDDLSDTHAKIDFCFGEENKDQEHFTITKSSAMVLPQGVFHLPLIFEEVNEPMIFISLSSSDR